ncbi:Mitochondrial import inner membrane translocase subunit tim8 [Ptychographa xylographoides]|nr:Mitochondrial import inner membrane translocase subunit tim8 [Ptychographa xylographoides]
MDADLDLSKLSENDKKELQQFIVQENQQSMVAKTISNLTDTCWKKCIGSRISAGKLDRTEESCAANCVDRFMDTQMSILKHLEELRAGGTV